MSANSLTQTAPSRPRSIIAAILERRPVLMSTVVLAWSIKYAVSLALTHTTGPEVYGVLIAAISAGAALANLAVIRSSRTKLLVTAGLLALWMVVALGGVAGVVAHVVGPDPGHGPLDIRPRPIVAPVVFTALGLVGATALFLSQRAAIRRALGR